MASRYFTLSLQAKLVLAVISASTYWILFALAEWSEALDRILEKGNSASHLIGIAFGALVMAPYVTSASSRVPRVVAMCVASAVIYYGAVRFVFDGPASYDAIVLFLIAGGAAALLVGLAVALLAPRRLRWTLPPIMLVAGGIGGAVMNWQIDGARDFSLVTGHFAWQILVCLALHFGFHETPT